VPKCSHDKEHNPMANHPIIQVLIVDDHEMVRRGLAMVLAEYEDIKLMGQVANGQEAVDFCSRMQPDVILMDLSMPVMDGITATQFICKVYPHIMIVILTSSGGSERIQNALEAGAKGYMRKNVPVAEIVVAIRAAVFTDN
jgi:DNA-binding NarL/FixJ family response regulator